MRFSSCLRQTFIEWTIVQVDACFDVGAVSSGGRRIETYFEYLICHRSATERWREGTFCQSQLVLACC